MSLKEDFARNRAVFEQLTSVSAETEDNPTRKLTSSGSVEPKSPGDDFRYDDSPPLRSFSLSRANPREYSRETGMALSFEAPADIDYPALRNGGSFSGPDPLDSLYHQLEIEARQVSQLSCEEDF